MKKILFFLFLLCLNFVAAAQFPLQQNIGNDSTLLRIGANSKGAIRGSLIPSTYTDTTQANLGRIDDYPFAIIGTSGDGNTWMRNYLATGWVRLSGGTSPSGNFWSKGGDLFPVLPTPYPTIGTLAPWGGGFGIMTNSVVRAAVPDGGFTLSNDTSATKVFTWNPTTKDWGYANWNNGGGGSGGGWDLTGNSGTNPSSNWVGTNDAASFLGKVDNRPAFYIRRTFSNDSTSPQSPGRGFTTFGLYAGQTLIDNIVADPADSTYGLNNTLIGFNTGRRIGMILPDDHSGAIPSDENTFVGNSVGRWTRVGSDAYEKGRNTMVGSFSFFRNISGSYNNGFGVFALELNSGGNGNNGYGDGALRSNMDGDFNVTVGGSGMLYNSTGIYTVTINAAGTGYSPGDPITFSAPTTNGPGTCMGTATGVVATIDGSGGITGITVTYPGCGYVSRDDSCFYIGNCHPAVTATAGGAGAGASLTPVLRSGDRNSGLGTLNGAFNLLSQDMLYFGYGAGKGTRYWDNKGISIGNSSGVLASIASATPIDNWIAFGQDASVSESNTAALGDSATYPYKWVINGSFGDSAFKVNKGLHVTRGVRFSGIPSGLQAKRAMVGTDGTIYMADTLANPITGTGTVSGAKMYFPKFTTSSKIGDSRMMEITNATGNYISIDDAQTGATTTNSFLFNVANNYVGDITSNTNPLLFFGSRSASVTDLNVIKMEAASMPANSKIGWSLGRTSSSHNMYFFRFNYISSGSDSNYVDESFGSVANVSRTYASGNKTIGSSITSDNGYMLEVGNTVRVNDSLTVGVVGTNTGTINLGGATSGLVTIQPAAAAGTYTLTLPTNDGDASQFLQTNGSGVLSWATPTGTLPSTGNQGEVLQVSNGSAAWKYDTTTLVTFNAGANFAADTAAFTDSTIYGSFKLMGNDTFYVTGVSVVLYSNNAITDTLGIQITYNDTINVIGSHVFASTYPVNNGTTGQDATSSVFTGSAAVPIPPGNWVWLKSPTVVAGRKPYHMSVSIIGYKKRVN